MADRGEPIRRRHQEIVVDPLMTLFRRLYRREMEKLREAMRITPGNQVPFDLNEWKTRIEQALTPWYQLAFATGGRSMLLMSPTVQQRLSEDKAARAVLKQEGGAIAQLTGRRLSRRLGSTVETTFNAFADLLLEAVEEQLDEEDLNDLIESQWDDILGPRLDAISLTETQVSVGSAREYVATQVIELWDWTTAEDERVRPFHKIYGDAGAKPVGFNYATLTGGAYVLKYPADPACTEPGEVINCRCLTIPAGDVELQPDQLDSFLADFGLTAGDLEVEEELPEARFVDRSRMEDEDFEGLDFAGDSS